MHIAYGIQVKIELQFWMHKRKKESYHVCRRNIHMDHEISSLFNMKMLKVKPVTKLMDTYFRSNPKWKPPTMN
jgi:hypothetical protein